jgi:hypothetical protein
MNQYSLKAHLSYKKSYEFAKEVLWIFTLISNLEQIEFLGIHFWPIANSTEILRFSEFVIILGLFYFGKPRFAILLRIPPNFTEFTYFYHIDKNRNYNIFYFGFSTELFLTISWNMISILEIQKQINRLIDQKD